jgi:hypothetical protein
MIIGRGVTAVAIFAAVAVGTAGPARAGTNEMSGPFTAVEQGDPPEVWMFTPCGHGCAKVTFADGRTAVATVDNGQWILDELDNPTAVKCTANGSENPGTAHYSWDPTTLAGQTWATDDSGACGADPGSDTDGVPFNLTPGS